MCVCKYWKHQSCDVSSDEAVYLLFRGGKNIGTEASRWTSQDCMVWTNTTCAIHIGITTAHRTLGRSSMATKWILEIV